MAVRLTSYGIYAAIPDLTDSASPYFFIEKAGRRNVLISSAGACSFCMVMIAVMLHMGTVVVLMSPCVSMCL